MVDAKLVHTSLNGLTKPWTVLTNLYQNSNENRKMVLREKLKSIRMNKGENMTTYLTRITQVRDELGAIGEVIESAELVRTTLNGVAKPWAVFVELVVAVSTCLHGIVFGMISYMRRPVGNMYRVVNLTSRKMSRM